MAFIRAKNINGKVKHYLVESKREGKKVRQKVLVYLGEADTIEGAIDELQSRIIYHKVYVHDLEKKIPGSYIEKTKYTDGRNPRTGSRKYYGRFEGKSWVDLLKAQRKHLVNCEARLDKLKRL